MLYENLIENETVNKYKNILVVYQESLDVYNTFFFGAALTYKIMTAALASAETMSPEQVVEELEGRLPKEIAFNFGRALEGFCKKNNLDVGSILEQIDDAAANIITNHYYAFGLQAGKPLNTILLTCYEKQQQAALNIKYANKLVNDTPVVKLITHLQPPPESVAKNDIYFFIKQTRLTRNKHREKNGWRLFNNKRIFYYRRGTLGNQDVLEDKYFRQIKLDQRMCLEVVATLRKKVDKLIRTMKRGCIYLHRILVDTKTLRRILNSGRVFVTQILHKSEKYVYADCFTLKIETLPFLKIITADDPSTANISIAFSTALLHPLDFATEASAKYITPFMVHTMRLRYLLTLNKLNHFPQNRSEAEEELVTRIQLGMAQYYNGNIEGNRHIIDGPLHSVVTERGIQHSMDTRTHNKEYTAADTLIGLLFNRPNKANSQSNQNKIEM